MARQQTAMGSQSQAVDRRRPPLEHSDFSSRGNLRKGHPWLEKSNYSSREGSRRVRVAEVAGGTMAECAAVVCCCPCGLVDLLVLTAFKFPAGLCRKALRRRRHRRMQERGLLASRRCSCDADELQMHPITNPLAMVNALESDNSEVIELEKEMWDRFYGAGFWRSPSQRSEISFYSI